MVKTLKNTRKKVSSVWNKGKKEKAQTKRKGEKAKQQEKVKSEEQKALKEKVKVSQNFIKATARSKLVPHHIYIEVLNMWLLCVCVSMYVCEKELIVDYFFFFFLFFLLCDADEAVVDSDDDDDAEEDAGGGLSGIAGGAPRVLEPLCVLVMLPARISSASSRD